jgi:hypothetical protein
MIAEETTAEETTAEETTAEETTAEETTAEEKDYTLLNNFSSCPVIADIQNPNYNFPRSGVFFDEDTSIFKEEILKFAKIGIIDGYSEGTFQPEKEITRADFLKVVLVSHCYSYQDLEGTTSYRDVVKNTWQARVIERAQGLGMINGDRDENGNAIFRPNQIISKAEALKILIRMSAIQSMNTQSTAY